MKNSKTKNLKNLLIATAALVSLSNRESAIAFMNINGRVINNNLNIDSETRAKFSAKGKSSYGPQR